MTTAPKQTPPLQPSWLGGEQRRSQRVMIRMPVSLERIGNNVLEVVRAHTVSVNEHGALLITAQPLSGGTKLELRNERTGERQACHILRHAVEMPDGYYLAVEFDRPAKGFWHISFPPLVK